ncbi:MULTISPECIES: NeuD/PglB/VioB family sugar acetyltransferase [Thiomicrorhabdus]|uniref:NeuD/PglB/VioB family sugar acetyltransferase n=1 Tax=Thiomicrorhabdus heinhorstiae TaxID=2748010 RepID=A0ABS0C0R0_9GAMM|nr:MULTISPECIES: NeuD/PglB/VioB family sugar acetyltransferase [Thiomicrorhabdus]MBF6058671.1 NeuD/PglB/VioB family sugar acetyltransferase [Thiomicrorhabdus heinhorstiae]
MSETKLPLLLIGGGGHCRSCIDVIETEGRFRIVGIVEANGAAITDSTGYPVVGYDADLPQLLEQTPHCLITVGHVKSAGIRRRLQQRLDGLGAIFPAIVSPYAYVSPTAQIGAGCIVMHHALVNAYARIGEHCIINSKVLVEHDSRIEQHVHLATGSIINGNVEVGAGCLIGSGAVVKQGCRIAAGAIVGAGALILNSLSQAETYTGVCK